MPKGFVNKAGKLVAFDKAGKPLVSDQPFLMYNDAEPDKSLKTTGLKLVNVDIVYDRPKPRFIIKK
jgi:hypothetical protein